MTDDVLQAVVLDECPDPIVAYVYCELLTIAARELDHGGYADNADLVIPINCRGRKKKIRCQRTERGALEFNGYEFGYHGMPVIATIEVEQLGDPGTVIGLWRDIVAYFRKPRE